MCLFANQGWSVCSWAVVLEEGESSQIYEFTYMTCPDDRLKWKCKTCCDGEVYFKIFWDTESDMSSPTVLVDRNLNADCDEDDTASGSVMIDFHETLYIQMVVYTDDCEASGAPEAAMWINKTEPSYGGSCPCSGE